MDLWGMLGLSKHLGIAVAVGGLLVAFAFGALLLLLKSRRRSTTSLGLSDFR